MRRFHCDTADWHVFARGARRLELFRDDEDFGQFVIFLKYALKISGCLLCSFTLMTNHYHLVLRGTSSQLTGCMRRVNSMYSRYHNRRYRLTGHAFDGPYQAFRQVTPFLTLRCLAYVFANPVKGGLCRAPEDYAWSCYRSFINRSGSAIEVDPTRLFDSLGMDPKVAWGMFHDAMERELARPSRPTVGKPTMVDVHLQQFEWLLEHARHMAGAGQLMGEEPVTIAIVWARKCGISPRAIAQALDLDDSEAIRQVVCRFSKRLAENPSLEKIATLP